MRNSANNSIEKRTIDLYRAGVLFLIAILYAEWIPFFLQIVMNFIVFDEVTDFELVMIASFALTPVVSFLFSVIAMKWRNIVNKLTRFVTPILMAVSAVLYWLFYAEYYNFIVWDEFTLPGVTDMASLVGYFGNFTPITQNLLFYANMFTFLVLIPVAFLLATKGTSCLQFDSEFNYAAIGLGLYMLFRFGSILGTPLRISMAIVCVLFLMTISRIVKQKPDDVKDLNSSAPLSTTYISTSNMPKLIGIGILTIFGFWIGAPGLLYNGMLFTTWIWAFFLIGAVLHIIKSPYSRKAENQIRNEKRGTRAYLLLGLVAILVILSGGSVWVLSFQPWLISIGLLLFIYYIPGNPALFSDNSGNRYLTHPIRLFLLGFFTFLSFAISFVAVMFQPISSWVVMLFQIIFILLTWKGIRKNFKKRTILTESN